MSSDSSLELNRAYNARGFNRIQIPSSTPESLVFPYDAIAKKFNTTNYFPIQTQGRVTAEEIETFLAEVNEPVQAYYKKYDPQTLPIKWFCMALICMILFPLFPFFMCYMCYKTNEMGKDIKKGCEKAASIVKAKNGSFTERGLTWNIPVYFPHWIELWTTTGGAVGGVYTQPVQPYAGYVQPGIKMQTLPQQNYQNAYVGNNQI